MTDTSCVIAYIWDADHVTESAVNTKMLSRAVSMVEALAPNLRYVVLPTGTKVCRAS